MLKDVGVPHPLDVDVSYHQVGDASSMNVNLVLPDNMVVHWLEVLLGVHGLLVLPGACTLTISYHSLSTNYCILTNLRNTSTDNGLKVNCDLRMCWISKHKIWPIHNNIIWLSIFYKMITSGSKIKHVCWFQSLQWKGNIPSLSLTNFGIKKWFNQTVLILVKLQQCT